MLLTRLPFMSMSLDEVDSANFYNALTHGYNIPWMRPHPPGYPVYTFLAWLSNVILDNPLRSLTTISALLGSLAIIPFYLLLREFVAYRFALVGSILFVFNPLVWVLSEAALSDAASMSFAVLLAWLSYKAKDNFWYLMWACVVCSLAIGVRQSNVLLALLIAFPLAYRGFVSGQLSLKIAALTLQVFLITTLVWLIPTIVLGSGGVPEYMDALSKQWSTTVRIFDITQVGSPWPLNALYRLMRFFSGYFLTYPWAGNDDKSWVTLTLAAPWLVGFSLFVTGFRLKDQQYTFLSLWIFTILYTIVGIHFLPRYGLPQIPGFIMACILGYQFLTTELLNHARRLEILSLLGIGCMLILVALKYQPPVDTFEYIPPRDIPAVLLQILGVLCVVGARQMHHRAFPGVAVRRSATRAVRRIRLPDPSKLAIVALALLVVVYSAKGFALVSTIHNTPSPNQQMVQYIRNNYDVARIAPCWDNQTHSFFEAVIPEATPVGHWSIDALYAAYDSGRVLLISDRCPRYEELQETLGLSQVGYFSGESPLWAKTPYIRLYVAVKR